MALRECPECGASVKLENMKRHFANVHPGKDPSAAITEEEHREVRRAARPRSASSRRVVWWALAAVVIVAGGVVGVPYVLNLSAGGFNIVMYCGGEGTVEHYHPLLVINDNGAPQHLPYDANPMPTPRQQAYIGYLNQAGYTNSAYYCGSGIHALHTHDGSGIIHVELPVQPPSAPTLGNFFTIWGEPLSSGQVWTFSGTVTATVLDFDTGRTTNYSSNPASIPLYVPAAGVTGGAYAIPQSLIFNGAYGSGESGGYFSGEVIWLNVTG